jgi:hypothetical protein
MALAACLQLADACSIILQWCRDVCVASVVVNLIHSECTCRVVACRIGRDLCASK